MADVEIPTNVENDEHYESHALGCVAYFLNPGEVYLFALTCSSALAAVRKVHKGGSACQSSAVLLLPGQCAARLCV